MTRALILLAVGTLGLACGPNQRILESSNENQPASEPIAVNSNTAPAASSFEQDLNAMSTADFNFIYVFRRKDGGVLDADDKRFIGGNTLPEMNRRKLSDGGKALIMGSNFRPQDPSMLVRYKARFAFEDFSKPESELPGFSPPADGRGK